MATNRLYLRCTICQAEVPIARVNAGEIAWTSARAEAIQEFEAFLSEHQGHDGQLHVELSSENTFMLTVGRPLDE